MGNHRADRGSRRGTGLAGPASAGRPQHSAVSTAGDPVDRSADYAAAGKRKASRRTARAPLARVPAIPTLVGVAVLAAAAGGAVGFGGDDLTGGGRFSLSAGAADLTGTDAFDLGDLDSRSRAISRDSQRQALRAAAKDDLQAAVEEQAEQRNAALASLAKSAEKRADEIARNLWELPVDDYRITATFGDSSGLWAHGHTGLDFAAHYGTPIKAIANGVITDIEYDRSYGRKTVQTLTDGTEIWYCHQSSYAVKVGDKVVQGEKIGAIGSTGNSTGPHVHIEVRPDGGDPVDPYPAFVAHGITP